jgi:hypothetical protein
MRLGLVVLAAALCYGQQLPTSYNLAAGAAAPVTDASGTVWSPDAPYVSPAGTQLWSGCGSLPVEYQSQRWSPGAFSYQLPVANGVYNVTLKWAEPYFVSPDLRQFNVTISGVGGQALTNFDIVAAVGACATVDRTWPVVVATNQLEIGFSPGDADNPIINAISITPAELNTGPAAYGQVISGDSVLGFLPGGPTPVWWPWFVVWVNDPNISPEAAVTETTTIPIVGDNAVLEGSYYGGYGWQSISFVMPNPTNEIGGATAPVLTVGSDQIPITMLNWQ